MPGVAADLLELLACPSCRSPLRDLACPSCRARYDAPNGIPRLRGPIDARSEAVRQFYASSPFPGYAPGESLSSLRARAGRSDFARLLNEAIAPDALVLEMGCGTGQMSLFLASADRRVIAADLSRPSLELGADAARRFGLDQVLFVETDLQMPGVRAAAFDVVYCSGVLHHTPDPRRSFAATSRLVRPGGFLVVGLYNAFARIPHGVRRTLARLTGIDPTALDPVLQERQTQPGRREAWLRDQYHHPEEHWHTLAEVRRWFRENDIAYLRSYPAAMLSAPTGEHLFSPIDDAWWVEELLMQASWTMKLSHEGGLFVVIGRRGVEPTVTGTQPKS